MKKIVFPTPFSHAHPPVQNANELFERQLSVGQRAADRVASVVGSWPFLTIQSSLLVVWVIVNVTGWIRHWDPYPFILMNLLLSMQAAFTAPILMMSQNRQAEKDRLEARIDFAINQKAEEEVRAILEHLAAQDEALGEIHILLETLADRQADIPGRD